MSTNAGGKDVLYIDIDEEMTVLLIKYAARMTELWL